MPKNTKVSTLNTSPTIPKQHPASNCAKNARERVGYSVLAFAKGHEDARTPEEAALFEECYRLANALGDKVDDLVKLSDGLTAKGMLDVPRHRGESKG